MIETCEESGSYDLPAYLDALAHEWEKVDFVVGLDSGCGDYERLWATTSLRGLAGGRLTVDSADRGRALRDASGIVPSSFRHRPQAPRSDRGGGDRPRPARRISRTDSGGARRTSRARAEILGDIVIGKYPFADGTQTAMSRTAPRLCSIERGAPRFRSSAPTDCRRAPNAGNVLRPQTSLKLSLRLPPPIDGDHASQHLKRLLEADPPYGANVHFDDESGATGWNAPPTQAWLGRAIDEASSLFTTSPCANG